MTVLLPQMTVTSVKIDDNTYYVTPTGVSKGFMTPEMICKVDGQGNLKEANGPWKPSSEFKMHLKVYQQRPDVNAVVHAHPPIATSFAIAGIPLDKLIMPEAIIFLGAVPIAQYGTPSTMEIPESLEPYLQDYDAILLANHGALSFGCDLNTAFFRMESTEFYAKLLFYARMLGGEKEILAVKLRNLSNLESNSVFRVSTLWKSFVRVVMKVTILAQCHRQRLMKSTA